MNLSDVTELSQVIIENWLIALSIPYTKTEVNHIQQFVYIDYSIEPYNLVIQLYHVPKTVERNYLLKHGQMHHDNRVKYLQMQDKNVLSLKMEDAVYKYKQTKIYFDLEMKAYKGYYEK